MLQTPLQECTESSFTAETELHLIAPEMVSSLWSTVSRELERAINSPDMDIDSLRTLCEAGDAQLWVIVSTRGGVLFSFTTEVFTHLTGWKTARITYGGGSGLKTLQETLPQVEIWAASMGCDEIEIYGRKGWGRVFPDYTPTAVVFTKEL